MPRCPMCSKNLVGDVPRQCPSCKADLDLLVDFVSNMKGRIDQADALARNGELGRAVWKYLEVLEVDPANQVARHHIGQVVTAVRTFDSIAPSRRWALNQPPRRWIPMWMLLAIGVVLMALAFSGGFLLGTQYEEDGSEDPAPAVKDQDKSHMGGGKK